MFDILLESRRPPDRMVLSKGSITSLTTHALIVAVVAATAGSGAMYLTGPIERAIFLAPLERSPSTPVEEHLAYAGSGDGRGRLEGVDGATSADALLTRGGRGSGLADLGDGESLRSHDSTEAIGNIPPAFTEFDVESVAERDPTSAAPPYPGALLRQNIEGSTLVQFVVDSMGGVDMRTFREVKASHPLFTLAVYSALPRMHYRPASIGGRPVRQLVQQEFKFRIVSPTTKPVM